MLVDIVTAIGLVFVIEGLLYALAPGRLKKLIALARVVSEDQLRFVGIMSIAGGVVIVWIARGLLGP